MEAASLRIPDIVNGGNPGSGKAQAVRNREDVTRQEMSETSQLSWDRRYQEKELSVHRSLKENEAVEAQELS